MGKKGESISGMPENEKGEGLPRGPLGAPPSAFDVYEIGDEIKDPISGDKWRVIDKRNVYHVRGRGEFESVSRWATAEEMVAGINESAQQKLAREEREIAEGRTPKEKLPFYDRWKIGDEIIDTDGNVWVSTEEPSQQYWVADALHPGGAGVWLTGQELTMRAKGVEEIVTIPLQIEDLREREPVWTDDANGQPTFGARFLKIEPNGDVLVLESTTEEKSMSGDKLLDILRDHRRLPEGWKLKEVDKKTGETTMHVTTEKERTIPRALFLKLNKELLYRNGRNGAT